MPRGNNQEHTAKQKRQAEHIEKSYLARGVPAKRGRAIAWSTVNKLDQMTSVGGKRQSAGRAGSAATLKTTGSGVGKRTAVRAKNPAKSRS